MALGIGLALISTVALAIYQHCVKRTKGVLSAHAVLALNYGVILLPALAVLAAQQWYSGATDGLAAYRALGTRQWAYLLVLSVGIYLGAMQLQLIAIRQLGPTMLAAGCRRLAPDGDLVTCQRRLLWLLYDAEGARCGRPTAPLARASLPPRNLRQVAAIRRGVPGHNARQRAHPARRVQAPGAP